MAQMLPLPTCDEYGPLDAHLDELEEPGTAFLQDFIVVPQPKQSDTPLSHSNGYTSEESESSVMTPSDKQDYRDMSFLQTANTSEIVDVVGALSTKDLTSVTPDNEQQRFIGKVIKGKTSKYRGVTQTSKTSWGAKYSAKRITNTCKTPEEAAHVYDEYLKSNYPHKFSKFANFCHKCGKFVNPLGLPQFQSECACSASSPTECLVSESDLVLPKKEAFYRQQITTPTTTQSLVPPMVLSPAGEPSTLNMMGTSNYTFDVNSAHEKNTTFLSRRSSNLSASSLKLSFLEDTEQFFAESFNDVAKMSLDRDGAISVDEQQQQVDQKHGNLPNAVNSLTQEEEYLDQIIKDIDHFSSPQMSLSGNITEGRTTNDSLGGFTATGRSGESGKMSAFSNYDTVQVESTTLNSLEYDVGELDELTRYFLSENDAAVVVQREIQVNPVPTRQSYVAMGAQDSRLKKIHSLDFDSDNAMASSSRRGIVTSDVKLEGTEKMNPFLVATPAGASSSLIMPLRSPSPAIIGIKTQFLEKYWRNDRKNIQCFPYCPEHGDYHRVRIENLLHRCKGVCRAPVEAHISISAPAAQPELLVLARCNSIFSRKMARTEQQSFSLAEIKLLQNVSVIGVIDHFAPLNNGGGGVQFGVTFHPDVWKFEFDLPKKRRYVQSSNSTMSSNGTDNDAGGDLTSEFLYFFEIDVFYSRDKTTFERLGHAESINFQIGNTRTLLRQRKKIVEELHSIDGSQTLAVQSDSDKLVNADEMPEKKKVKVYLGQREILSGTSLGDDETLSGREVAGSTLSTSDTTDEGVTLLSKQNLRKDKATPIDVEGVNSDVWKDVGDVRQAAAYDYHTYVSPKQKSGNVETVDSWVATAISVKANTNARPTISISSVTMESHSLHKLLRYAFECVLISVLFIPVGVLLLLGFLMVPPVARSIVCALDLLSDMELSRANSSCIARDQRLVLNRLVEENTDVVGSPKGGMFRYHGKGEVWGRILYFSGAKLVVSMVSLVPAVVLAFFAGSLYPIRPASAAIASSACSCVLWSREYTRSTTGKRLVGIAEFDDMGGLV